MKVIPISYDREPGAAASKKELALTRRSTLKGIDMLVGISATDNPLALLAPSTVWVVEPKALSKAGGDTLLQMERMLLPYVKLPDAAYALLVKDPDAKATQDTQTATQLREDIAMFDRLAGDSSIKASVKRHLATAEAMEGKPLFSTVRGQCVTSLYDNEMAFAMFGYPGSARGRGGYIIRGFQDPKWLPASPVEVSPPPLLG